jgi:hypothetical protein
MCFYADYALIAPDVLVRRIETVAPQAVVFWRDIDEDTFEVSVGWEDPDVVTYHDLRLVEDAVAPYVA